MALISEILWKAANEYLWDGSRNEDGEIYSCVAVREAQGIHWGDWHPRSNHVIQFLKSLGCPVMSGNAFGRGAFPGRDRQGARYAWLMFASMYAAELESKGEL